MSGANLCLGGDRSLISDEKLKEAGQSLYWMNAQYFCCPCSHPDFPRGPVVASRAGYGAGWIPVAGRRFHGQAH